MSTVNNEIGAGVISGYCVRVDLDTTICQHYWAEIYRDEEWDGQPYLAHPQRALCLALLHDSGTQVAQ